MYGVCQHADHVYKYTISNHYTNFHVKYIQLMVIFQVFELNICGTHAKEKNYVWGWKNTRLIGNRSIYTTK